MSLTLKQKKVKTAKPHRCFGCTREIPRGGSNAIYSVGVLHDSDFYYMYLCTTCDIVLGELSSYEQEEGFCEGSLAWCTRWKELSMNDDVTAGVTNA